MVDRIDLLTWLSRQHGSRGEPGPWWWNPLFCVTGVAETDELAALFAASGRDANARTEALRVAAGWVPRARQGEMVSRLRPPRMINGGCNGQLTLIMSTWGTVDHPACGRTSDVGYQWSAPVAPEPEQSLRSPESPSHRFVVQVVGSALR